MNYFFPSCAATGLSAMKLVTQPARSYSHALSGKSRAERDYIPTWSFYGK